MKKNCNCCSKNTCQRKDKYFKLELEIHFPQHNSLHCFALSGGHLRPYGKGVMDFDISLVCTTGTFIQSHGLKDLKNKHLSQNINHTYIKTTLIIIGNQRMRKLLRNYTSGLLSQRDGSTYQAPCPTSNRLH